MKLASPALQAYLKQSNTVICADLYTISLVGGGILRYMTYPIASLTIASTLFPGSPLNFATSGTQTFIRGPIFERTAVTNKVGIDPAEMEVKVAPSQISDLIGNLTWQQFAEAGGFDGAYLELDRLFIPPGGDGFSNTPPGVVNTGLGCVVWFYGQIGEIEISRTMLKIKTEAAINQLTDQQLPLRVFQTGCQLVFGGTMCGYDRVNGKNALGVTTGLGQQAITAQAGSTQGAINTTFSPSPTNAYDQGTIVGNSGGNSGISRAIATLSGGVISLFRPFPFTVSVGDSFNLLPGCPHTSAYCNSPLQNLLRYTGFDYIPAPEIAL